MAERSWLSFESRWKSITYRSAALILVLLTTACPAIVTFYRPSAPEGRVVHAFCPPEKRYILFERLGVTIGATMGRLSFIVPEGAVVTLIDQDVEISTREGRTWNARLVPGTQWLPGAEQPNDVGPDIPLIGFTSKSKRTMALWWESGAPTAGSYTGHAAYSFKFPVSTTLAEAKTEASTTYILRLPKFSVNGTLIELPLITFIHDSEFTIVGMNC